MIIIITSTFIGYISISICYKLICNDRTYKVVTLLGTQRNFLKILEVFLVEAPFVSTTDKIYQTEHFRCVHFIVYKFYFNLKT